MNVRVRYLAQLRQAAGRAAERVDLEGPADVATLLRILATRDERLGKILFDAAGRVQPTLLLFIGEDQVRPEHSLHEGDELTLMTPIAGGA